MCSFWCMILTAVAPCRQRNTSASPARLCGSTPCVAPRAVQCKLSQEPPSSSAPHRETLNRLRDFAAQEGRDWPALPADDPFAGREDPRLRGEIVDEAAPAPFTFGILIPGYVTETVAVELAPPLEVAEALRLLSLEREQVQARVYPRLVAVSPQPAQSYGLVMALPVWAEDEVFVCLDLLDVDYRLYVESAPTSADKARLLRLAGLPEQAPVDVYIGESAVPLQPAEEAALFQGLCVFFTPQHDLPGPFFWLEETLLSSDPWEVHPDIPTGVDMASLCGVAESGHREVSFADGASFADTAILARAFRIAEHQLCLQPTIPQVRDVAEHGRRCRGVYAVSGMVLSDSAAPVSVSAPVLGVIDCRGLLQGWHLLQSATGETSYAEVVDLLSTFAPPGWRLYLEGMTIDGDVLRYAPGAIAFASYLPASAPGAPPDAHSEAGDEETLEDDLVLSDVEMPPVDVQPRPSRAPGLQSRSNSRSRSPLRPSSPHADRTLLTLAAGGHPFEAVFLILAPELAPVMVVADSSPTVSVPDVLMNVQRRRDSTDRTRFPWLVPVHPQPVGSYVILLALPVWCNDSYVAFDLTRVNGTVFCSYVRGAMAREHILALAGFPADSHIDVYVHDLLGPLAAGEVAQLANGYCISFLSRPEDILVVASFEDRVSDAQGWDSRAPLPVLAGFWVHVLDNNAAYRLMIRDDRRRFLHQAVAMHLDYEESSFLLKPARPPLQDSYDNGVLADNVLVVLPRPEPTNVEDAGVEQVLYLLDMRPITCGLTWGLAADGKVREEPLRASCGDSCPPDYHVLISGGHRDVLGALRVRSGDVLTVDFVRNPPRLFADAPSEDSDDDSSSSSSSMDSGAAGPAQPTDTANRPRPGPSRAPDAWPDGRDRSEFSGGCESLSACRGLHHSKQPRYPPGHGRTSAAGVPTHGCFRLLLYCMLGLDACRPSAAVLLHGPSQIKEPTAQTSVADTWLVRYMRQLHPSGASATTPVPTTSASGSRFGVPHCSGSVLRGGNPALPPPRRRPVPTPCRRAIAMPLRRGPVRPPAPSSISELAGDLDVTMGAGESFSGTASQRPPQTLALSALVPAAADGPHTAAVPPEVFPLDAAQCLLPGDPDCLDRLLRRVAFSAIRGMPAHLPEDWRFASWVANGCVGRSPGPAECLVLTSDGSYCKSDSSAGWGLTFSIYAPGQQEPPGQFTGCIYGTLLPYAKYLGHADPDAYDAEVVGLLWCAVVMLQLPAGANCVVRADNTSALQGVQGQVAMRPSALCEAARALHAAAGIVYPGRLSYGHVQGHAGDPANELSDALAARGASGHQVIAPFAFDVDHFLREDAAAAVWVPHACLSSRAPWELPRLHRHLLTWTLAENRPSQDPSFCMRPFLRAFPDSGPEVQPEHRASTHLQVVTYNVLSLLDGARDSQAGLHGQVGRPTLLQASLAEADVHIAGLQECRTPPGRMRIGAYSRFSSGCDELACFGVELWVRDDGPCSPDSVVVLFASPTVLIASLVVSDQPCRVFVGHGPHRSHPLETRRNWWISATRLCHSFSHGCPWIFLLDANCRVGSRVSQAIGAHHGDEEDEAGGLFHSLLLALEMWLPSTFVDVMIGDGGTLKQKRSGAFDRSDFVGLPQSWRGGSFKAWVDPLITSGHACVDHFAVRVAGSLLFSSRGRAARCAARIDPRAILDPGNAPAILALLRAAPRPDWGTDVSEHAALVIDHLYTGLVGMFPVAKRPMRAGFFTEATAALHRTVAALRHSVRSRNAALRLAYVRCVWIAWASPDALFECLFTGPWLWRLRATLGRDCMLLRRFGLRLRASCRQDKAVHLASLSDEIATAPSQEIHRAVQRVLKPRKFRRTSNDPLPTLEKSDGSLCHTAAEVTDTWREHFCTLEGGVETTPEDLVLRCQASQAGVLLSERITYEQFPSWLDLEKAFRHSAPRKASGPDLLPPAICRVFSTQLTELFWPLLLKSVCRVAEPAGLKGGILYHISKGKPGLQRTCDAHRGILAQSCISKAFHRSLRKLVVQHWTPHALPLQLGGRAGCSAVFGHLCSRSILEFAWSQRLSAGLLFVDLASAYYAVIRQTVLGPGLSDRPIEEIASSLGLDSEDLQMLRYYVEQEPVLWQQGASAQLTALARELHQQTWFILNGDTKAIETQRGTRPGGTLADVLFNVLFGKVLVRRQVASLHGLFPRVPWDGCRTPFPADLTGSPKVCVSDIVYADDLCTPVVCQLACQLRPAVSAVVADTMDVLTPHALRANLGPTKTAAVVAPVGAGSRQARHEMFVSLKGRVPIWPDSKGLLWLDLVPRYKHLGSLVSYDCRLGPEVRHRLALANAAFRDGRRKLYACQRIPIAKRATLLRSHVLSVLLVGAGSWPVLLRQDWAAFSGGVIGIYRQLLGLRATGDWHLTKGQLLARVGLPSPEALLHLERLRFLAQLVRDAPDQVWALVAWNQPFQQAVRAAGSWFYDIVHGTCTLGPIADDWASWAHLMKTQPGRWRGMLRRAEAWHIAMSHLQGSFDDAVRTMWAPRTAPASSSLSGLEHGCLICGLAFGSFRKWGAHAQRKHGYRNAASQLAKGRRCLACNTLYASCAKLKTHLLSAPRCRLALQRQNGTYAGAAAAVDDKEGHPQAPYVRGEPLLALPRAEGEICSDLLRSLRSLHTATDQEIYDVVAAHVAPLPVLRHTLRVWIDALPSGALADAAEDVLLILVPEHVCSALADRTLDAVPTYAFEPRLDVPTFRISYECLPVLWVGSLDLGWLAKWDLAALPRATVALSEIPRMAGKCRGLCVAFPAPPIAGASLLRPLSVPLRILRSHAVWAETLLAVLPGILAIARVGVPVLVRFPLTAQCLEPLAAWLQNCCLWHADVAPRPCFTVEFNAMGTSL